MKYRTEKSCNYGRHGMKKIQEASEDITCWRNFVQVPKPIQKKKTKRKEKTALRG